MLPPMADDGWLSMITCGRSILMNGSGIDIGRPIAILNVLWEYVSRSCSEDGMGRTNQVKYIQTRRASEFPALMADTVAKHPENVIPIDTLL